MLKTFGKLPAGPRLARLRQSPNYRDGEFRNLSETRVMAPGTSFFKLLRAMWQAPKTLQPAQALPFMRTDLHRLPDDGLVVVWLGHSSYLLKLDGKLILVDPVLSGNASPFSFLIKAFPGTNEYRADDLPDPDVLVLTHDHYDHLDYKTILLLKNRLKQVLCPLGVGAHLEYWGVEADKITEVDWDDRVELAGLQFTAVPARHFSGRGLSRARALWTAYVLTGGGFRLFLGGDSGYDAHFKAIGAAFGPFDLAIMEIGQYNDLWPLIHAAPEQTVQAALDLGARLLLPVHWGKFALAFHPWDEPIRRLIARAVGEGLEVTTPLIGEPVTAGANYPRRAWWAEERV